MRLPKIKNNPLSYEDYPHALLMRTCMNNTMKERDLAEYRVDALLFIGPTIITSLFIYSPN